MFTQNNTPVFSLQTSDFIYDMSSCRSGMLIIAGDRKSGKTSLAEEYLRGIPQGPSILYFQEGSNTGQWPEKLATHKNSQLFKSPVENAIKTLREAIGSRASIIIHDMSHVDAETLSLLAMASLTCSVVLTYPASDFYDLVRDINEKLDLATDKTITHYGFWSQVKGITVTTDVGSDVFLQDVLAINADSMKKNISTITNKSVKQLALDQAFESAIRDQGFLNIKEQQQNLKFQLPAATIMALRHFLSEGPGLAVIFGDSGPAKKAVIDRIQTVAHVAGKNRLLVFADDIDSIKKAIHLSTTHQVLLALSPEKGESGHFHAFKEIFNIAGSKQKFEPLFDTLRFIATVDTEQSPFIRPFLTNKDILTSIFEHRFSSKDSNSISDEEFTENIIREQGF